MLKDAAGVVTDTATLAYDPLGALASAADADSQLTWTYDPVGRLTQVQTAATGAQPAATISHAYDLSGNRVTMTDPQGGVTTYAYDALNRLVSLTSPDGTTTFAYDALGRRTGLTRPNGTQTTATYDAASQLTDLVHTAGVSTLSRFAYTYDPVGNRATRTTPSGVAAYTYDGLNRLTQAQQPNPVDPLEVLTETFAYDPVGNRTASHLAIGQLHDAANRLLEDSAFTFQYDATGNLTATTAKATGATTTYAYDVENRLVAVSGPGLTASYAYDPLGRRITKTVNSVVTRYVYDREDVLVEYDGTGTPRARYTHGPGIDEPLARADVVSGQTVFYHADGLGSITELTDGTGAVVQRYRYDAFGALLASPGTVTQPYTFTGREFDAETGLYYYRARYYKSSTGRFLQEDPIDLNSDGSHLYPYAGNNPTNWTDPLGLQPNGPPPVPVPGARPGNDWKVNPDPGNSRGGTWGPQKPIPGQSQPSASWDPEGHWDIDDGHGNRQRYDQQGRPLSPKQAHRGRRLPPPPVPQAGGGLICPLPLIIPDVELFQNYLDFLAGKGPSA